MTGRNACSISRENKLGSININFIKYSEINAWKKIRGNRLSLLKWLLWMADGNFESYCVF